MSRSQLVFLGTMALVLFLAMAWSVLVFVIHTQGGDTLSSEEQKRLRTNNGSGSPSQQNAVYVPGGYGAILHGAAPQQQQQQPHSPHQQPPHPHQTRRQRSRHYVGQTTFGQRKNPHQKRRPQRRPVHKLGIPERQAIAYTRRGSRHYVGQTTSKVGRRKSQLYTPQTHLLLQNALVLGENNADNKEGRYTYLDHVERNDIYNNDEPLYLRAHVGSSLVSPPDKDESHQHSAHIEHHKNIDDETSQTSTIVSSSSSIGYMSSPSTSQSHQSNANDDKHSHQQQQRRDSTDWGFPTPSPAGNNNDGSGGLFPTFSGGGGGASNEDEYNHDHGQDPDYHKDDYLLTTTSGAATEAVSAMSPNTEEPTTAP